MLKLEVLVTGTFRLLLPIASVLSECAGRTNLSQHEIFSISSYLLIDITISGKTIPSMSIPFEARTLKKSAIRLFVWPRRFGFIRNN